MRKERLALTLLMIVVLVCLFIVLPIPNKPLGDILPKGDKKSGSPIRLGIDLAGGIEVWYYVFDPTGKQKVGAKECQEVLEILRRRIIDAEGLTEPKMNVAGDNKLVIQIAGTDRKGWEKYRELVEKQGILHFRAVSSKEVQMAWDPTKDPPSGHLRIKNEKPETSTNEPWMNREYILVKDEIIASGQDLVNPHAAYDTNRMKWVINFTFKGDAAARFEQATKDLKPLNGRIAILEDGKLLSMPVVEGVIRDNGVIQGGFTEQSARALAQRLASGSLPFAVGKKIGDNNYDKGIPEFETVVGPTLGEDSIRRGVTACIVALCLVALFMIAYYRMGGFIAVISLVLNLVFIITAMVILGAVMTLPGFAALVLTVGMAVDANILILERVREEQKKGKTAVQAFEHATSRATVTIIDSNLTTLIIGLVLYFFGSGSVKGFAVTLNLGIIMTLISVLYCGGIITRFMLHNGIIEKFNMMELIKTPNVNFIKFLKPCAVISVIIVVGSLVLFFGNVDKSLGLDFSGGVECGFQVWEPEEIDAVRDKIKSVKTAHGTPKYADAEIQIMAEGQGGQQLLVGGTKSRGFKVRTKSAHLSELKDDIQTLFKDKMSFEPIAVLKQVPPEDIYGKPAGAGFVMFLKPENYKYDTVKDDIEKECGQLVSKTPEGRVRIKIIPEENPPKGLIKLKVLIAEDEKEKLRNIVSKVDDWFSKPASAIKLSDKPFLTESEIGPAAAKELFDTAMLALIISWVLIIAYVAVRFFFSFNFGLGAVVALVHDAIVSIGVMVACKLLIPESFGLDFSIGLGTMAAILTIVGYSVNDTIVIFDRIRENLVLNKKAAFADIINESVNQTLSRTILTAFTVWVAVVVLYVFTMTSSTGIATLTFPLLIGVVAGTYSTIYIASPLMLLLYGGKRPKVSVT